MSVETLCEALAFDWERTSPSRDVRPAIEAVRNEFGSASGGSVTVLKFSSYFKSGTIPEVLQSLLDRANITRASIPAEVPELPASLQPRTELLSALKERVLVSARSSSVSLVGAQRRSTQKCATTSAHGMGGVGKTLMAAQLIRDAEVGAVFHKLLWVSVGQEPDIIHLLRMLHYQLTSRHLPASALEDERFAVQAMREACKGIKALLVLDDIWDPKHAELLNVIDPEAGAASVITTRLRNMSEGEISCGLLSTEESISLLLTSAGLEERIHDPPPAAYEAIECCGRLALALPIAGGMIREMKDVWETDLVPILKGELAQELSTEGRIVSASLKCVDPSQRAGVESLFVCFGCFAEDEQVPPAALDLLAPIVCGKAGVSPVSHIKSRKWLASLQRASLLHDNSNGIFVHDLVRDVMIDRADQGEGGVTRLQRSVLEHFLDAYDGKAVMNSSKTSIDMSDPLREFILKSIKHHVTHSQDPEVNLWEDELLMRVLTHKSNMVCARAVRGIGMEELMEAIRDSEGAGCWFEAALLCLAAASVLLSHSGEVLKRGLAAIGNVPESNESRAVETKIITMLTVCTTGGYKMDSPEHRGLLDRLGVLIEMNNQEDTFDSLMGELFRTLFAANSVISSSFSLDFSLAPLLPLSLSLSFFRTSL